MNTSLGYSKRTLDNTKVLLSGGGDKLLSEFIGSISWDAQTKELKYTPIGGNETLLATLAGDTLDYVSKDGDTMSGDLTLSKIVMYGGNSGTREFSIAKTNNGKNVDIAWNWNNKDGAGLALRSVDMESGAFVLWAKNSSTYKQLIGKADGTFTWDGNNVLTASNSAVSLSGSTLTVKINGTSKSLTNTWNAMTGATSSANGTVGYVNAVPPKDGYNTKFLRADGTWSVPAYPTKSSWNYDDVYVKSVSISDNSLRVSKNGIDEDLTIPFATKASQDGSSTTIRGNYLRKVTAPNNAANNFNDFENMTLTGRGDPTTGASLSHAPWTGGGPAGGYGVLTYLWGNYGTQMAWGYNNNHIYIRNKYWVSGRTVWADSWSTVALTSDIPTNNNQLTNGAGYITSSGSCAYATSAGSVAWSNVTGTPSSYTPSSGSSYYLTRNSWWANTETHDANDLRSGVVFAYDASHHSNTATTGTLVAFSCRTNDTYTLQLQGQYSGENLYFRNRNGDNGTWKTWRHVIHSGNISSLSVNYATSAGNVTGTVAIANGGTGSTTAAGARANLGTWALISDSYDTLIKADGSTNGWIKIGTSNSSYGLLPSTSGGAGSGHNYLGTSSWYWKYAYIDQIYGYLYGSGATMYGSITPNTDNAIDLGSSTKRWRYIYSYGMWGISGTALRLGGNDTTLMYLTSSARCGIGTDSPGAKLGVAGGANMWTGYFSGNSQSGVYLAYSDGQGAYICSKKNDTTYLFALYKNQTSLGSGGDPVIYARCDGNVGVGNSSPSYKLHVSGNVAASNFYTTSDRNKKQNISLFSEHIRKFQLKDTEKWHYGVIAQEVPEMFRDGEEGNMTVNYTSILSYYVGLLENKVASLEKELSILKQKLK